MSPQVAIYHSRPQPGISSDRLRNISRIYSITELTRPGAERYRPDTRSGRQSPAPPRPAPQLTPVRAAHGCERQEQTHCRLRGRRVRPPPDVRGLTGVWIAPYNSRYDPVPEIRPCCTCVPPCVSAALSDVVNAMSQCFLRCLINQSQSMRSRLFVKKREHRNAQAEPLTSVHSPTTVVLSCTDRPHLLKAQIQ